MNNYIQDIVAIYGVVLTERQAQEIFDSVNFFEARKHFEKHMGIRENTAFLRARTNIRTRAKKKGYKVV